MSNKPGRNEPCRCGSGKKYKRCCLPADEAAARERAQQVLFDDDEFDDSEFDTDDEDEGFVDYPDEPIVDVRELTRVCYTRGFVSKLSDLRSGRGVLVTEWEAPHIPPSVLDSIEREAVDVLEGEWGNPKVGTPIQVDIIDLETDNDVVSIEVFNRAILLGHDEHEEIQRIHRVCGALETAASGGPDQSEERAAAAPTVLIIQREEVTRPSAAVDMSGVLKEHRRQGGACELCGESVTRASAQKHLAGCAPAHDTPTGAEHRLVQVRAMAPGLPAYWLALEVKADAKLEVLDRLLRQVWLECCGHLSVFRIAGVSYFSRGYDFEFTRALGTFGGQPAERSMGVKVGDVVSIPGEPIEYEYDFGSTTALKLTVMTERAGRPGRSAVRLLARNTPPVWPCGICRQPASWVCAYCLQGEGHAFACTTHRAQHGCDEQEGFLPVVNSPRMGVCGYTAQT
jgi:SEC-C motif